MAATKYQSYPPKDPQKEADSFNRRVPVGTMVRYWKMDRRGEPTGTGKIRHEATVLSGHTAVGWIEGCSGCVAITHIEVVK